MYINYLNFPTVPLPLILNTELIVNTNIYTLPNLKINELNLQNKELRENMDIAIKENQNLVE